MNEVVSFVIKHPYVISLVLFIILILRSKVLKRKKLLSIAMLSFPFSFVFVFLLTMLFKEDNSLSDGVKPLFLYITTTNFFENQLFISLLVAAVVFAEYKKLGFIFVLLAVILVYNILSTHVLLPADIAGSLIIAVAAVFIANKIIDKYY